MAQPSPTIRVGPTWTLIFHCSHATWTVESGSEGEEGRKTDLWWHRGGAAGGGGCNGAASGGWGLRWPAVLLLLLLLPPLFFFSLFSALFFFFWFLPFFLPLFCSLSLSLSLFSLLFFSTLSSLVFIGKKQGRETGAVQCDAAPPTRGKCLWASGVGRHLFERESMSFWRERWRWQRKKKSSSSPASCVQGKKKTHSANKTAPFRSLLFFFREQCMKRHRFGKIALFHLKGKGSKICQSSH